MAVLILKSSLGHPSPKIQRPQNASRELKEQYFVFHHNHRAAFSLEQFPVMKSNFLAIASSPCQWVDYHRSQLHRPTRFVSRLLVWKTLFPVFNILPRSVCRRRGNRDKSDQEPDNALHQVPELRHPTYRCLRRYVSPMALSPLGRDYAHPG